MPIINFLPTIPPASIELDCAFSSAGILCSKLRSCTSDAIGPPNWTTCSCAPILPKTNRPLVNAMHAVAAVKLTFIFFGCNNAVVSYIH